MKIISWLGIIKSTTSFTKDMALIRASGFFDADWYRTKYSEINWTKIDPLFHYLRYGGMEGRDPGPGFCSSWYLYTNKDVERAGLNPLVHYLRFGREEGRKPTPEVTGLPRAQALPLDMGTPKVFCVGLNKTGTTSLEHALRDFGYKVGDQSEAELLMDHWAMRDFRPIIRYCESADAFQDVPFSLDFTYQVLDQAFPGSKFILTVRNNSDEWYQSLVRFHSKLIGVDHPPTVGDLEAFSYHYRGYLWRQQQSIFGATESTLYDRKLYKAYYTNHNRGVLEYFKYRPGSLLVLNLSNPSAMQLLCEFLGINYVDQRMPHLNKSGE